MSSREKSIIFKTILKMRLIEALLFIDNEKFDVIVTNILHFLDLIFVNIPKFK